MSSTTPILRSRRDASARPSMPRRMELSGMRSRWLPRDARGPAVPAPVRRLGATYWDVSAGARLYRAGDGVLDRRRVPARDDDPRRGPRVRSDAQLVRRHADRRHRRRPNDRPRVHARAIVRRARRRVGDHAALSLASRLECDARRRPHPWDPRARLPADDRSVRVRRGRLSSANLDSRHPLRVDRRGARTAARVGRQRCRAGLVRARRVSRHRDLLRRERRARDRHLPPRRDRVLHRAPDPDRRSAHRDRPRGFAPRVFLVQRRIAAILKGRCPRCLSGPVWRSMFAMNDDCPVCGLHFEREPGYWTGAMIASYSLGVPVLVALFVALWLLTRWDVAVALVIADLAFIAAAPFVWRYSRVLWLHLDWIVDPVRGCCRDGW